MMLSGGLGTQKFVLQRKALLHKSCPSHLTSRWAHNTFNQLRAPAQQPAPSRMTTQENSTTAATSNSAPAPAQDPVVQYVILRKDLWTEQKWPLGSVVAQACHASSAAMWMHRDDEITMKYLADENLDHMHKVVLEVKGEAQLKNLSEKLTEAGVKHKLWVEQPENYPTCLATKPYHKSEIAQHFKKFQLCKAALGV